MRIWLDFCIYNANFTDWEASKPTHQLAYLTSILSTVGPRKEIPVLMHLISAMFDSQRGKHQLPPFLYSTSSSFLHCTYDTSWMTSDMRYHYFFFQSVIDDYMDLQQWRTCYRSLFRVTSLLHESKGLILGKSRHRLNLLNTSCPTPAHKHIVAHYLRTSMP